ncbi:uncharacterized protein LOC110863589 isoform X2 [Folsomia candida]|uniref:Kelch-like protein 10 n=1 Tax=Folsomia candida TaxID=158441 RepID=A0A226EZ88_FOLCA|nr:uncharacterized protein LOC110863589 isoform X2 [Folsomia candida]OXA62171.1 Kelch-like protein 10 [Folsomia candida]
MSHYDLTVFVGTERTPFNLHKSILVEKSPWLKNLIDNGDVEVGEDGQTKTVLHLPNHSVGAFSILIKFLHTGEFAQTENYKQALEVMDMSCTYHAFDLLFPIADQLMSQIEQVDAIACLEISRRVSYMYVGKRSFECFLRKIRSEWTSGKCLTWDFNQVKDVLSQDCLEIREIDLFKAILIWTNHPNNIAHKSKQLPELVSLIRFSSMRRELFEQEVVPSNILSDCDVDQVFIIFDKQRLRTSKDITLRGVIINAIELLDEFMKTLSGSVLFELSIATENGDIVVAGSLSYGMCSNAFPGIPLDPHVELKSGRLYQFSLTCKPNQQSGQTPVEFGLYIREQEPPTLSDSYEVDLGLGVTGTMTHFPVQPSSEGNKVLQNSSWIRNLLFGPVLKEIEPCVIT